MINESLNINNSYNYVLYDTINDEHNGNKYTTYIFKFRGKNDNYYVTITFFEFNTEFFSCDFQIEEDFINDNKNKKDLLNRTYTNTNKFDSFMVLSTVFKIIYDFYEYNKEILHSFSVTADDDKRHNIYKHMFMKFFPDWKLFKDEKDDNGQWSMDYKF